MRTWTVWSSVIYSRTLATFQSLEIDFLGPIVLRWASHIAPHCTRWNSGILEQEPRTTKDKHHTLRFAPGYRFLFSCRLPDSLWTWPWCLARIAQQGFHLRGANLGQEGFGWDCWGFSNSIMLPFTCLFKICLMTLHLHCLLLHLCLTVLTTDILTYNFRNLLKRHYFGRMWSQPSPIPMHHSNSNFASSCLTLHMVSPSSSSQSWSLFPTNSLDTDPCNLPLLWTMLPL